MPRSRSRDRIRDHERSKVKQRNKKSRSRSRERKRSRDRGDYKRRERSVERHRRDKYDSHKRRTRSRSYERSRDRSHEKHKDKRRDSRERRRERSSSRSRKHRSVSSEKRSSHNSSNQSNSVKPIVIVAASNQRSNKNKISDNEPNVQKNGNNKHYDHRESFEISNEFSREGFEQFSRDHGIDFTKIETIEDREAIHKKMEDVLKAHFAAQGKVYPPPPKQEKPAINAATGFANDGSFLEQFKKMQEEYQQQQQNELKRQNSAEDNLKNLPIRRRRGGKILKTGVVAKTKLTNPTNSSSDIPSNAWGIYIKEVQKYKSSSCDSDSKNRPLVK